MTGMYDADTGIGKAIGDVPSDLAPFGEPLVNQHVQLAGDNARIEIGERVTQTRAIAFSRFESKQDAKTWAMRGRI